MSCGKLGGRPDIDAINVQHGRFPCPAVSSSPSTSTTSTRLSRSIRRLFRTEPAKLRPGYANFAIAEPPLKLVLLENPGQGGSLNHLGVEVPDTDAVDAEQARLAEAGLASGEAGETTCCYAKQDKFWVQGAPDGEAWEIYTVLADSPTFYAEGHGPGVLRRHQRPHRGSCGSAAKCC